MYDALTARYTFACPRWEQAQVALSSFRLLERLPGPSHPAVYGVRFDCGCGDEHPGLVTHDDLDWAPLGAATELSFRNLMTSHDDSLATELTDLAAARIRAGVWPWSFFCLHEGRPRPMTPSALALVAPGAIQPRDGSFGIAVRCPGCSALSVNLVTREHVDIPFWNDTRVGVLDHVLPSGALQVLEDFRAELGSARFDEKRLDLEL